MIKNIDALLDEVVKEKEVKGKALVKKGINQFLTKLKKNIVKDKVKAKVMLGGSAAKGTFIGNEFDCDIFVRFDLKEYKDKDISKILSRLLKDFKAVKVHGSRDYFQVKIADLNFEIVPVLYITNPNQGLNVTDSSPLHVQWILSKIKEFEKKKVNLRKEIMLTKIFCKANKMYGAESYIKGFSGHVIDILTARYGGFLQLLKASQSWKYKEVIDIEKHGKVVNRSKLESALIVVDPIQFDRNAAASLSKEKFDLFRKKAKEFLENPGKSFFVKNELKLKDVLGMEKTVVLKLKLKKSKQDIMGAKIIKVIEHLENNLEEYGVVKKGYLWDKGVVAYVYLQYDKKNIPDKFERIGPPEKAKSHFEAFMKKHKDSYVKDNRAYANVKREITNVYDEVTEIIKKDFILEKVKEINLIGSY